MPVSESRVASPGSSASKDDVQIFATACALTFLAGLNAGWIGPIIPTLTHAQDMTLADAGTFVSIYFASGTVPLLLGGPVIQRLGPRNALQLSALLFSLGFLIIALANGKYPVWLGGSVFGVGAGLNGLASNIAVLRIYSSTAATALNKMHLNFGIGALLGPFIAWASLNSPASYRLPFLIGSVFGLAVAVLIGSPKPVEPTDVKATQTANTSAFKSITLWLYVLAVMSYVGIETGVGAWLYTYLVRATHLDDAIASLSMSVLFAGMTAGRLATIHLSRRVSTDLITAVCMTISFISLYVLLQNPLLGALALLFVGCLGLGFGPTFPNVVSSVNSRFPGASGTIMPVVMLGGSVGGILFPWITGTLFTGVGLQEGIAFLVISCLVFLTIFSIVTFKKN